MQQSIEMDHDEIAVIDTIPPQPEDREDNVIVPLYSKFRFSLQEEAAGEPLDTIEALKKVKEILGAEWADLAEEAEDGTIRVKDTPEIAGRGRLPMGTKAGDMKEWKTLLVFPSPTGGPDEELPADEVDLSARDIVTRNGRVVCVIPVIISY